jgi:hypothetical protein
MNSQHEIFRRTSLLSLVGLGLFGFALLAPSIGEHQGSYFSTAMHCTWRGLWEFPAAWSSLRIILLSAGLFLLIESTGTILAAKKFKSLVLPVFLMQAVPCLGLLFGGYYLVKSLL